MKHFRPSRRSTSYLVAALAGVACLSGAASAATIVTYNDRTTFTGAAGVLAIETFNDVRSDTSLATAYDAGAFTLTALRAPGASTSVRIDAPPFVTASTSIDGTSFVDAPVYNSGDRYESVIFSFDQEITAFGANFISNLGGRVQLLVDGQLVQGTVTRGGFFGFISDTAFKRVELRASPRSGYSYAFDNVTFSSAVPEPASWAMMIGGFCVLGAHMRRRPAMRRARA